ncbi:MAG: hypothetical protein ACRD5B_07825 [Nitrososphaeraceae archaeon]
MLVGYLWRKPIISIVVIAVFMPIKMVRLWSNVRKYKEVARENTRVLSKELLENSEVSWTQVLDMSGHDELVYKLTLKYLRQHGYDIGNNKIPRVKLNTGM